jgi:hypothetical protein
MKIDLVSPDGYKIECSNISVPTGGLGATVIGRLLSPAGSVINDRLSVTVSVDQLKVVADALGIKQDVAPLLIGLLKDVFALAKIGMKK